MSEASDVSASTGRSERRFRTAMGCACVAVMVCVALSGWYAVGYHGGRGTSTGALPLATSRPDPAWWSEKTVAWALFQEWLPFFDVRREGCRYDCDSEGEGCRYNLSACLYHYPVGSRSRAYSIQPMVCCDRYSEACSGMCAAGLTRGSSCTSMLPSPWSTYVRGTWTLASALRSYSLLTSRPTLQLQDAAPYSCRPSSTCTISPRAS
jgi:hypothetical protein